MFFLFAKKKKISLYHRNNIYSLVRFSWNSINTGEKRAKVYCVCEMIQRVHYRYKNI